MTSVELKLIGHASADIPSGAHVLLSVVRDEVLRLPYFLDYYRGLGFGRFVFVDNASTDGTREFLLAQPDTLDIVFHTDGHFGAPPGAGLNWKHAILDRLCDGHWVLVADADEILVWPDGEAQTIRDLSRRMEELGAEILFTLMIDLYSDRPFGEIGYRAGAPFIEAAPFFDRGPYFRMKAPYCPFMQVWGGVRTRIWESEGEATHPPMIGKVPFLRWRAGQRFIAAQHLVLKSAPIAPFRGALLHFKMFDDLADKCAKATASGEYYQQSREYRVLASALMKSATKCFFDPSLSLRYRDARQLLGLDLVTRD